MGEETIQFALRYTSAVNQLAQYAGDETHADLLETHGSNLPAVLRGALDAVAAVYETGTNAVRDWREQRRRVLAQIARIREVLDRSGSDADVRRLTRTLVDMIAPRSGRRQARPPPRR